MTRVQPVLDMGWRYLPLLLLALLWEGISQTGLISQYALPPLSGVLASWWELIQTSNYWDNLLASLSRGARGLGAAIVVGITLGVLMAWFKPVDATVGPIVQIFYPMPKSALIPLTIIWFGLGDMSKIFLIFLGCLLPVLINTFNGVRGAERTLVWSARSLGATRTRILWDVAFFSAVPDILTGVRTAMALGFVLLISSELVIASNGLGFMIRLMGEGGYFPEMFAVIFTVMLLGFVADRSFLALSRWLLRWR